MMRRTFGVLLVSVWASLGGASCDRPPEEPAATLDPAQVPVRTLRVAMSAAFVSEAGMPAYRELVAYVGRRVGIEGEFVSGLSYATIATMIGDGAIDVGFLCGLPYTIAHDGPTPTMVLIAAPVMQHPRYRGAPKYFSDLIVRRDHPAADLRALAGATLAYPDELSNSGYNMPRAHLLAQGLTHGLFGRTVRSGSHEESIRMVASGEADAAFVDSLVLDFEAARASDLARAVRIVESIGPAGIPPVVASAQLAPELRARVHHTLTTMHQDPEGRLLLERLAIARFEGVDDHNYDDVRTMHAAAIRAGFTVLR